MKEKFLKLVRDKNASGELLISNIKSSSLSFENGRFKTIEEGESGGIAVRVIKDGKIGFSFSTSVKDIDSVVDESIVVSKLGDRVDFDFNKGGIFEGEGFFDGSIEKLERGKMVELGKGVIDELKSFKEEIEPFFYMEKVIIKKEIVTTNGFEGRLERTVVSFALGGQIMKEGDFLSIYTSKSFSKFSLIDIEKEIERVKELFKLSEKNVSISTGNYPVIFTPRAINSLLLPLSVALNGKYVVKGLSLLRDRMGERIFSENFSLTDSPLIEEGPGSMEIDDEGSKTKEKLLIENGVLKNFLTDLESGKKLSLEGGNGLRRRGFEEKIDIESTPSPAFTNRIIGKGNTSYNDLVKNIKKGIIVDSLMGVMMGNVLGGEVNGNIELGFLVENGEIVGRVKNISLKLNIFRDLKELYPSKEREWADYTLSPYILIPSVSISGK